MTFQRKRILVLSYMSQFSSLSPKVVLSERLSSLTVLFLRFGDLHHFSSAYIQISNIVIATVCGAFIVLVTLQVGPG